MKYSEVAAKLKNLGCEQLPRKSEGSHQAWYNPSTSRLVTLPDRGDKDLRDGTIRAALGQLGIEWSELENN